MFGEILSFDAKNLETIIQSRPSCLPEFRRVSPEVLRACCQMADHLQNILRRHNTPDFWITMLWTKLQSKQHCNTETQKVPYVEIFKSIMLA